MAEFKLKKQRLIAIFDAYYRLNGRHGVTMLEVSEWAVRNGLYPVPDRSCDEIEAEEWERLLALAENHDRGT